MISANGSTNGIVWALDTSDALTAPGRASRTRRTNRGGTLQHDAECDRDQAGDAVKFTIPTVANGKVYVGTETELDVYGVLP